MTSIIDHLVNAPAWAVYTIVGLVVFAEDALFVGFALPGETVAILGGVAASRGHVPVLWVIAVVVAAAVVGDSVGAAEPNRSPQRLGSGPRPARLDGHHRHPTSSWDHAFVRDDPLRDFRTFIRDGALGRPHRGRWPMRGAFMLTFNGADESGLTSGEQRSDQAAKVTVPRFSVVVPGFNEAIYIGDCLRSLAVQDFPGAVEVIVVDNNSTDDTATIARAMGATVVREVEPGVCCARHRGTQLSRGEIIVSTDADTTFDPGWLSSIDRAFARNPGCVAVAGPCRFVGGPFWAVVYPKLLFGLVHLLHLVTGRVCYVSSANLAFRRDAWTGYDTRLTQGGDELDLLRRLRARGRLVFDLHNPTRTSARRLNRGLIYNIAVTFLFYYVLGYCLNRPFHRRLVGTAPAVRGTAGSSASRRWRSKSISSMLSAPATIPATSDVTFTSAFAHPHR